MCSSNMLWRDKSSNIICFPTKIKEGAPIVDGGQEVSTASDLFPRLDHEIISVTHAGSSRPSTRRRRRGKEVRPRSARRSGARRQEIRVSGAMREKRRARMRQN